MISDKETNFIYLSDLFEIQCPSVYQRLVEKFDKLQLNYSTLPNTKDLWVVDFMPLQINQDVFLQFNYSPDYLKGKKYHSTRTNPEVVNRNLPITPQLANIVLDGGNIVKSKNKVILTTKIFKENPGFKENDLVTEIKKLLQVKQVIIIPQEPLDYVGHADSMVRFVNEETVLVNEYPKNKTYQDFSYILRWSLKNAGLEFIEIPYTSWLNEDESDATGCYINFLEVDKYIFCPVFGLETDALALEILQKVFKDREIIDLDCSELAKFGGVLNCATWNILK